MHITYMQRHIFYEPVDLWTMDIRVTLCMYIYIYVCICVYIKTHMYFTSLHVRIGEWNQKITTILVPVMVHNVSYHGSYHG